MTLTELFKNSTDKFGSNQALVFKSRYRTIIWTYKELGAQAIRAASVLRIAGVKRGEPVLLWAENSPHWVAAFFGIMIHGGVVVPIPADSTGDFVERVALGTAAAFVIKGQTIESPETNLKIFSIEDLFEDNPTPDREDFYRGSEDDIAEIVYTSGTTGDPKGVPLTHFNIVSNIGALSEAISVSERDKFLSILPLSHMFEQTAGMIFPLSRGASITYVSHPSSGAIMAALQETKSTKMLAVPEFLGVVMRKIELKAAEAGKAPLLNLFRRIASDAPPFFRRILFRGIHKNFGGRLRIIASGGASLPPIIQKKWELLGFDILQGYGLTETSPVLTVNTLKERRMGSVGKPLSGVGIKIAPDGEILARGPNVFGGYLNDETKTRESFVSGWFKTGDLGEVDADGFVYVKGRKKYVIVLPSGQKVYPEDIEFEINARPGVRDSAVLGLKRDGLIEIHAVLLLEDGADPRAVVDAANKNLPQFQKIHNFSVWPEGDFPRSATRKVKKEVVFPRILQIKEKKPGLGLGGGVITPVIRIVGDILEIDPLKITGKTRLVADLGLDSILRIELVARIEEQLGFRIEEASITEHTSISDLEKVVDKGRPAIRKAEIFSRWPYSFPATWLRSVMHFIFLRPLAYFICRPDVYGLEVFDNLIGPAIIMPNHRSVIDPLILSAVLPHRIRERIGFALAADVAAVRWFPLLITRLLYGAFPFPRGRGGEENIESGLSAVGKLLDLGWSAVIFPEGEISPSRSVLPLKRGAGLLALEMKVPVIPVFMTGTEEIVPWGKLMPQKRVKVVIRFGNPLYFKEGTYDEATEGIAAELNRLKEERR